MRHFILALSIQCNLKLMNDGFNLKKCRTINALDVGFKRKTLKQHFLYSQQPLKQLVFFRGSHKNGNDLRIENT